MVWRRRVILTRSSRLASAAETGPRGTETGSGDGALDGADFGASACFSGPRITSSFMMRPSLPVPLIWSGLSPFSAIILLAEGAFSTSLSPEEALGASDLGWSDFGAASAGAPDCEITASLPPASTVVPSSARISLSVPEAGEGTSTETLSVSSSQSISSTPTLSPGFLNQVATVASVTLSPRAGTMTSTLAPSPLPFEAGASAGFSAACSLDALPPSPDAAFSPSLTVASSASTPTVSPSGATISDSTPAALEGTSTVTLSVSSSQSISSTSTGSPGFLNQVATVASVTLSPSVGTRISAMSDQSFLPVSASFTNASCCALCVFARPVAGEAAAERPE